MIAKLQHDARTHILPNNSLDTKGHGVFDNLFLLWEGGELALGRDELQFRENGLTRQR